MTHEGPAGERGGGRRQDKDPKRQAPTRDEVVGGRLRRHRALDAPEDTVGPIESDEGEQPDDFRCHGYDVPLVSLSVPVSWSCSRRRTGSEVLDQAPTRAESWQRVH